LDSSSACESAHDLAAFVASQQVTEPRVRSRHSRGNLPEYVVKYVEPATSNRRCTEWNRKCGRESGSARSGTPERASAASCMPSGSIGLVRTRERGRGFLFFVPVYKGQCRPTRSPRRTAAAMGDRWFSPDRGVGDQEGRDRLREARWTRVVQRETTQADNLLYDSGKRPPEARARLTQRSPRPCVESACVTSCRGTHLNCGPTSTPAFESLIQPPQAWAFIAWAAHWPSFMMAAGSWLMSVGPRARAKAAVAHRMTGRSPHARPASCSTLDFGCASPAQMRQLGHEGFTRSTGSRWRKPQDERKERAS